MQEPAPRSGNAKDARDALIAQGMAVALAIADGTASGGGSAWCGTLPTGSEYIVLLNAPLRTNQGRAVAVPRIRGRDVVVGDLAETGRTGSCQVSATIR
jgi:hypothetical protein